MAIMNWKQNIGEGGVSSERGKELLRHFRYPTMIDKKGRLLIDVGLSKFVIGFKENGPDSTVIGVTHFKMKPLALLLGIILLCAFILPGFIFAAVLNSQRKKVFSEAVIAMNQAVMMGERKANDISDVSTRLQKLQVMKEHGLISADEYDKKRKVILADM